MMKTSIRFYNDIPVRAVWNEERNRWFFSVTDVISAIRGVGDHNKNRNYWKYLKNKLKNNGSELVSAATQLKLTEQYGKKYNTSGSRSIWDLKRLSSHAILYYINFQKGYGRG